MRPLLIWVGGILVTLLTATAGALVVVTGCAEFGVKTEGEALARLRRSPQWHDEQFQNPQPIWADARGAWAQWLWGPATPDTEPDGPVPVVHNDASSFAQAPVSGLRVTWFGHSSALVEIDGARILIDPFWRERASPVSWAGPKRWYPPPVALTDLPEIDAVLISHDHHDHLDRDAIVAMKSWRTVFVVPLGVGAALLRWGIPSSRIIELDWWQSTRVGELELVATPARHASGRVSTKSNQSLWAGYAILGKQHRAWYSGDTGFHDDLARIGGQLGPFDVTLIESGQYDAKWPDTHLGPEHAVDAHQLVRGSVMIPVHWGLLKLARHGWTEPAERVLAAARCRGVTVMVPRPGQSIEPTRPFTDTPWWPVLRWRTAHEDPIIATRHADPLDRADVDACVRPEVFSPS